MRRPTLGRVAALAAMALETIVGLGLAATVCAVIGKLCVVAWAWVLS